MKRAVCLLLLSLLALSLYQPFRPALAGGNDPGGPGEVKNPVSKLRPFIEKTPNWEAGVTLCRKVVDGDKDAIAEFRVSGLTYVAHFSSIKMSHDELQDAYVRHLDWIEDMQKWEYAFISGNPAELVELFKKYEPRFRDADAQLARCIIYAHEYGDYVSRDALIAIRPKSPWVQAAAGALRLDLTPQAACEKMMLVLEKVNELHRTSFMVFRGMLVPREQRPRYWDDEMKRAQVEDFTGPDGIYDFYMMPHQWRFSLYYERLGALLSEVDDKEFRAEVDQRVTHSINSQQLGAEVLNAFHYPIWFNERITDKWTAQSLENRACASMGPNLTIESIFNNAEYMWYTRSTAAAIAFAGMPDNTLCRRNMLARVMSVQDPMLTRLACRSVLALYDDNLVGCSDIGRALMLFGKLPDLTAAWVKALRATNQPDLLKLAEVIDKGDPAPLEKVQAKALGLTLAQKAKLLATFCSLAETSTHGGESALYWLNLATFREATRSLRMADEAYAQAMLAAEGEKLTADVNPVILEYFNFCERNYSKQSRDQSLLRVGVLSAGLMEKLKRIGADLQDVDAAVEKNALTRARNQVNTQQNFSDELVEELVKHPGKWGGEGYALLGEHGMMIDNLPLRRRNIELAIETAPLNQQLHRRQGPENENAGTLLAANWDHAARHITALHLLQPIHFDTMCASVNMHVRNGESPAALVSQALAINSRAACAFEGKQYVQSSAFLQFGRTETRTALIHWLMSDPDRLSQEDEKTFRGLLWNQWWGMDSDRVMGALATFIGPDPFFARKILEGYTTRWNMEDVNNLLNFAIRSCFFDPQLAVSYVEKADNLGVSRYGEFVGTQALVGAKAKQGQLAEVLERYHDLRAGRVGMPLYLDIYMVAGLTAGNNHAEAESAINAIDKYDHSKNGAFFDFLWRRTFMLAGRHAEIAELRMPENSNLALQDAVEFTRLFHEARALLDAGKFEELIERTTPFLTFAAHDDMGVYLDAAVLKVVALKAAGKELPRAETNGDLRVVDPGFVDLFMASPNLLDWIAMEMLCGRSKLAALPPVEVNHMWHGVVFGERLPAYFGTGRISFAETGARDQFIRGVLAWTRGDLESADELLKKVVEFNVRSSHEYHVAEWLLANALKKPETK